jgi:hypothetical protein
MEEITDARLAAQNMIKIYGDEAGAEAAKRAQDARAARQTEAAEMWARIGKALEELRARTGPV